MGQHMSAKMKTEFIDTMTNNPVKIGVNETKPETNEVSPPETNVVSPPETNEVSSPENNDATPPDIF
tara:strand:- start:206 stop:406 length:201 start_codon:yes stop_codon:yes gene_type:complete